MGEECGCIIEDLLSHSFPSRSFAEKKDIVDGGRPTPNLNSMISQTETRVRRFNTGWYESDTWLCGCKKSCSLYCWPCLLFSTEKNVWTTKGVGEVNSFHVLKKRHELTVDHVNCKIALHKFGNTRIEESLSSAFKINRDKHNENVKSNRYIVSCLIDAVCFLVEQELPFRGHDENSDSDSRGNYIQLLHHRASYDEKLRNHLESSVFDCTSHNIQNDLIDSISTVLCNQIKQEIKEAPFVSIIEDVATDVTRKSQLSTILRYITPVGVQERFIRFTDISSDCTAVSLAAHVFIIIQEFQIGNKLVSQTYDGCSIMAGVHKELQQLIRARYHTVLFVLCYAHKLNLVLKQSVDNIKECKVFFETLSGFSTFFSRSSKRKAAFHAFTAKHLPSVAPTCSLYTQRLVEVISEVKGDFTTFLKSIMDNKEEWDSETRIFSRGFYATLQDFEFIFLLNLFSSLLPQAKILFNKLQAKVSDIRYCSVKIEEFRRFLADKRDKFDLFWRTCQDEHSSLQSSEDAIPAKRQRAANVDHVKTSYRQLYCEVLDTMVGHITNRFSEINKLEFLTLLDFHSFEEYSKSFPSSAFLSLVESYGRYFSLMVLKTELLVIYASTEFKKTSTLELYKYLASSSLNVTLPEVSKLCALILTIPTSSAAVERSLSAMKRIKTYLRSTQTQEGFTNLSFICIEKSLLNNIKKSPEFYNRVIDIFAAKNRCIELTYKL